MNKQHNESTAFHVFFFWNTIIFNASLFELILTTHCGSMFFVHVNVVVQFILGLNFIFFCLKIVIVRYHTLKQKKRKVQPRMKLNHNINNNIMFRGL